MGIGRQDWACVVSIYFLHNLLDHQLQVMSDARDFIGQNISTTISQSHTQLYKLTINLETEISGIVTNLLHR